MVRDELYITVPSPFRCPISMDVMRSPVSLCTGVTYDRSSIQHWLDAGHDTCPATMQILPSKDFIPNLTLRRLINLWAQTNGPPSPSPSSRPISDTELRALVRSLDAGAISAETMSAILALATSGEENRRILASSDGFLPSIVGYITRGGSKTAILGLESAVRVLDLVLLDNGVPMERIRSSVSKRIHALLASILVVLRNGKSPESKIAGARVLKSIAAVDEESTRAISENRELVEEIIGLIGSGSDEALREAALSAVIAIAATRSTKAQLVSSGVVRHVAAALSDKTASKGAVEKAMKVAGILSTCAEGRSELGGSVAAAVVERLLKVSREAREEGVTVLWHVCCGGGGGDRKTREAVARSNGVAKVLLVMQSGCCDRVRRMCGDLLRVLRAVSSFSDSGNAVVGLESYESRTTHIMHC